MDKIVSLTTIPARIPHISKTLQKLCESNTDYVILNIPDRCEKTGEYYPKDINNIFSHKKFFIHQCFTDWGPATKIIPVLELKAPFKLFVCDDDMMYEPSLVNYFFDEIEDGKFVCGNGAWSGCTINDVLNDNKASSMQGREITRIASGQYFFFPEVFAGLGMMIDEGIQSRPEFLNLKKYTKLSKACRYSDDLCIGKWFDDLGFKEKCFGFDAVKDRITNMNNYNMPHMSLAGGAKLTGGNRENYKKAFLDLTIGRKQVENILGVSL